MSRDRIDGLMPASLDGSLGRARSRLRMPVAGGTITMTTDEGVGVLIPGPPRDLVVLESDDPVPVTIYAYAECLQDGGDRPVSSTEVQIEWTNKNVTFVERWHPTNLVRNLTATRVRVSAVFRDAGYTSPRSGRDRVTAWACPGHASAPYASRLYQIPTQVADPTSGVASLFVPPFCTEWMLLCESIATNSFFATGQATLQFVEGGGTFQPSLARGLTYWDLEIYDPWVPVRRLPPGCRSFLWSTPGAAPWAWVGDDDWIALQFVCRS